MKRVCYRKNTVSNENIFMPAMQKIKLVIRSFATISMVLLAVILLQSCESDFLVEDPKGSLSPDGFFASKSDLDLAITAVYHSVSRMHYQSAILAIQMGADDMTTHPASNKKDFRDFDKFEISADNNRLRNVYTPAWRVIWDATYFINNYEKTPTDRATLDFYGGQAHFMRALAYFKLVRGWGRIPIIEENVIDYNLQRREIAEVYELIVDDLKKAEAMLSDKMDNLRVRPGRGSAKAMLAEVYLTMAGWPLNKGAEYYAMAAEKAGEVIQNKALYGVSLEEDFARLWQADNYNSSEIMFAAFFNMFLPTSENLFNMISPNAGKAEEEFGWSDFCMELQFYEDFPENYRKRVTVKDSLTRRSRHFSEVGIGRPFYRKWEQGENVTNWYSGRTVYIWRLAHTYLTYAEAKARSGQMDASAEEALNVIRRRAHKVPLYSPSEYDITGLSATEFADAVVAERGWEFTAEPEGRWWDLVRLEKVEEAVARRSPLEISIDVAITKDHYHFPFIETDQLLNPNLR